MAPSLIALIVLTVALAMGSGAAFVVAWVAQRRAQMAENAALEARTRAAMLESALHDQRRRKSDAVSRGNRTRAAKQAALRKERLAELQDAVALKRAGGQHSLPLEPARPAGGEASAA